MKRWKLVCDAVLALVGLAVFVSPCGAQLDAGKLGARSQREQVQKPSGPAEFVNWNIGGIWAAAVKAPEIGTLVQVAGKPYLAIEAGKGCFAPIPLGAVRPRTVAWRNCRFSDIDAGSARHTEGLWIATNAAEKDLTVEITDCEFTNISGGGVFVEYGSSGTFILRRNRFSGIAYPGELTMGLMSGSEVRLVLEDNDGMDVVLSLDRCADAATVLKGIRVIGRPPNSITGMRQGRAEKIAPALITYANAGGTPALPATVPSADASETAALRAKLADAQARLAAIGKLAGQ